jgi:hypothetical protein
MPTGPAGRRQRRKDTMDTKELKEVLERWQEAVRTANPVGFACSEVGRALGRPLDAKECEEIAERFFAFPVGATVSEARVVGFVESELYRAMDPKAAKARDEEDAHTLAAWQAEHAQDAMVADGIPL